MSENTAPHEFYMRLALEQAQLAMELGEVPVGAVVVNDSGIVVAKGMNRVITDSDPTAHAEVVAMRRAGQIIKNYRLVNLKMYVTLEPCLMCTGSMIHARLSHLYFGASDFKTGACGSVFSLINDTRHNHQIKVEGGILGNECKELLQSFFRQRRKEQKLIKSAKEQTLCQ